MALINLFKHLISEARPDKSVVHTIIRVVVALHFRFGVLPPCMVSLPQPYTAHF
jgi:hypothetical protein